MKFDTVVALVCTVDEANDMWIDCDMSEIFGLC